MRNLDRSQSEKVCEPIRAESGSDEKDVAMHRLILLI